MKEIRFRENWNKKLTSEGMFTTIRKSSFSKRKYYTESVGETFAILLNEKKLFEAKLIYVWVCNFSEINPPLLMIDSGYDVTKIYSLFREFGIKYSDETLILVLQKVKSDDYK